MSGFPAPPPQWWAACCAASGESTQVLCVTHLPQVAGNGHQHMFVDKFNKAGSTETTMKSLDREQRIQELARLLGGDTITSNTLANARELLQ